MNGVASSNEVRSSAAALAARAEVGAGGAAPGGGTPLDRLMASGSGLARFRDDAGVHVVARGETLGEIAARAGTDWQTLARINGLPDPDGLAIGQRLQLPDAPRVHVVPAGETVSGIARAEGTTTAAIARDNRLADIDLIRPGQRLTIGASAAPAPARPAAPVEAATPATGNAAITPVAASLRAADVAAARAAGHQSIGKCYTWVKTALQQGGAVPDYMPGVAAKDAGPR